MENFLFHLLDPIMEAIVIPLGAHLVGGLGFMGLAIILIVGIGGSLALLYLAYRGHVNDLLSLFSLVIASIVAQLFLSSLLWFFVVGACFGSGPEDACGSTIIPLFLTAQILFILLIIGRFIFCYARNRRR